MLVFFTCFTVSRASPTPTIPRGALLYTYSAPAFSLDIQANSRLQQQQRASWESGNGADGVEGYDFCSFVIARQLFAVGFFVVCFGIPIVFL